MTEDTLADLLAEEWASRPPGYCECWICNPLVKAREKVGKVCPTTGLGFIGPMPDERTTE